MNTPFAHLELTNPVAAAPMSGGPSTPALVAAAARAGSLGFLAGGYKTADDLAAQISEVRAATAAFGVNLFAPNPVPVDPDEFRRYAATIQAEGERYGLDLAASPVVEDDDRWDEKIDLLIDDPVPVVSFTFGLPATDVIGRLQKAGTVVLQTVTTAVEAAMAAASGVEALVVQGAAAGGHSATLTPDRFPVSMPLTELIGRVREATSIPILAAGGVASPEEVAAVLAAGAFGVAVGTVLLRSAESGASAAYKRALETAGDGPTIMTRCFSGRPARALPNQFTARYDAIAPAGYPAVHHLTVPLRRAAAAAGDFERINIWAGAGYQQAGDGSAEDVLHRLAAKS